MNLKQKSARFGPYAIRSGSRRQREARGYTMSWGVNPYEQGSKVVDCGDVRVFLILLYFIDDIDVSDIRCLLAPLTTRWL